MPKLPTDVGAALAAADLELIEAARAVMRKHHRPFWHTVAAAIRGSDGRIWTGVHLGTTVGRLSICAEPIALGRAILDGDGTVATVVAVRFPKPDEDDQTIAIVSPCGACRELILDYAPDARVIMPGPEVVTARTLLPSPYRR
jgi:cytidine deaminase